MLSLQVVFIELPSQLPWPVFLLIAVVAMAAAAGVTGFLMKKFAPDAPGSGIPQVKRAYLEESPAISWNLIWVKFVGGVLSIGTGSSLGREGPTIHIGAALASKISQIFGEEKAARLNALCAGSAAGLAAAFGSPLAGVTLVLEEITGGKNENKFAGRALLAAALAAGVVAAFNAGRAVLPAGPEIPFTWTAMSLSPVVALWAGFCGIAFQWATIKLRSLSINSSLGLPMRLAFGAGLAAVISAIAFGITGNTGAFGLGESTLDQALNGHLAFQAALVLLIAKLLATVLCYGTGGCGGIFAPIIFFGAMAGLCVFRVFENMEGMQSSDGTALALAGMTACLAAVVRAPITSILIVVEMTRQIQILPILMVASVVGVFLNRAFFQENFYSAALRQDGHPVRED